MGGSTLVGFGVFGVGVFSRGGFVIDRFVGNEVVLFVVQEFLDVHFL